MSDERIEKIMEEYNLLQDLYKEFCNTIVFLLRRLLKNTAIQYQLVNSRVKDRDSLRTKLVDNKPLSNLSSIKKLDDIAGCRVIFYLENEINNFIPYIYQEFEVVKNNLRYTEDDYNAHHLIIKFKEERLNLTEYAQFKDLRCELQLTTVLFHAWSEVSHNITYKTPKDIAEFDSEKLDFLKNQLKDIMRNHIKPANFKFNFINSEYLNLLEGKEIFSTTFLSDLIKSKDRREMYNKLILLNQYIQKYGDKTPPEYKLPDFLKTVIDRSLKLAKSKQILGFGHEHHYIVTECIEIFSFIRYQYPESIFPILSELALDDNKVIRDKALNAVKKISEYNPKVLEKYGLSMQFFLIDQINNWSITEQLRRIEVIKWIFEEIFELEYEKTEMLDYKTFSFGFGLLSAAETVQQIREQSIQLLMTLYRSAEKTSDKLVILELLQEATKTPTRGNYSEEVELLVKVNTASLIRWYSTIIEQGTKMEIMKEIDEQTHWFKRRFEVVDGLSALVELLHTNEKYIIYKDLVGFDTDYLEKIDWRKAREIRNEKINQYINTISEDNEDYWTSIIIDICSVHDLYNQSKYAYFNQFLYELAYHSPKFAERLIQKHEQEINIFLYHIIAGLNASDSKFAHHLTEQWIDSGIHLLNCVLSLLYSDTVDIKMLERIFDKAIINTDSRVLNELFRILNTSKVDKMMSKSLYLKLMFELSEMNDYWWTNLVWFDKESILNNFDENEHDQVLNILKKCPQIDYHICLMLIPIARASPEKIIKLFECRVSLEEDQKETNPQYDAIPFHLHELGNELKEIPEICIPLIFEWLKKDDRSYSYEASNLLHILFPSFDESIESFYLSILDHKNVEEAEIILDVLGKYDGNFSIFNFSQHFVIAFHNQPDLLRKLMHVLSETGVVSGEYGFVEALSLKKSEIEKWNQSKHKAVRKFAKDFILDLDSNITAQKKRSDEHVQIMKHEFETP
jgi:ppGpp synthetase/RelA/SpoT-type nucleotidyltranferase